MIGIFAIFVRFKIVNDSAKMSFIKKIKLDPFQLLMDELQQLLYDYVFKSSCSQVHDKKITTKIWRALNKRFPVSGSLSINAHTIFIFIDICTETGSVLKISKNNPALDINFSEKNPDKQLKSNFRKLLRCSLLFFEFHT